MGKRVVGSESERTIVLGTGGLARDVVSAILRTRETAYPDLLGVIAETKEGAGAVDGLRVLGSLDDLPAVIAQEKPGRIVVALERLSEALPERLLAAFVYAGISVESGVDVYERLTGKMAIESLRPDDFLFSRRLRPSPSALRIARIGSFLTALASLLAAAPLMAIVAVAIKVDSKGPVFFVQERVGMAGRKFRLIKFRSMTVSGTERSHWAGDNGDRITRVGCWLRRFRLDEIPQFVNVLRGEMNIVGPRPHPVSSSEMVTVISRNAPKCGSEIPYYGLRSTVRPGITGWAQVRYKYANDLDEELEKLKYDLYYVKHYSALLDLRVILETVRVVFRGRDQGDEPRLPADAAIAPAGRSGPATIRAAPRPARSGTGLNRVGAPSSGENVRELPRGGVSARNGSDDLRRLGG